MSPNGEGPYDFLKEPARGQERARGNPFLARKPTATPDPEDEEGVTSPEDIINSDTPVENLTEAEIIRAAKFLTERGPFSGREFEGRSPREREILQRQLELMGGRRSNRGAHESPSRRAGTTPSPEGQEEPRPEERRGLRARLRERRRSSQEAFEEGFETGMREGGGGTGPFAFLAETPEPEGGGIPTEFTAGAAFRKATVEETLAPLRFFGVEVEETDTDHPIAEGIGKLTGLGIGIAVPYGAASWGLKGAGLIKSTAAGVRTLAGSEIAAEAAIGGLSFGVYEAGRQTNLEDAAKHFIGGATAGAIFDPIAMKALGPILGRSAKEGRESAVKMTFRGDLPVEVGLKVPSAQLSVERWLRPEKLVDVDPALDALRQIADPRKRSLQEVLANIGPTYQPAGRTMLKGIENPGEFLPKLKRALPNRTQTVAARNPDTGAFDILINDPGKQIDRLAYKLSMKENKTVAEKKYVQRVMGEGEPVLTYKEMTELVRENSILVSAPRERINEELAEQIPEMTRMAASETGSHKLVLREGELESGIAVVENFDKSQTLVHEYMHRFQTVVRAAVGDLPVDRVSAQFFDVSHLGEYLGRDLPLKTLDRMRAEMDEAMELSLGRFLRIKDDISRSQALSDARLTIKNNGDFQNDWERVSWLAELMYRNPKKAREIAPESTELLLEAIHKGSPRMEKMLTREHMVVNKVLKQVSKERRVFTREPVGRLTKAQRKQFKENRFFEGLEVYHDRESWEYVKKLKKSGLKRDQVGKLADEPLHQIRHPFTGDTKQVPASELIRPGLPRLMERQAEVVGKVNQLLDDGLGGSVMVALREPEGGNLLHGQVNLDDFLRTEDLNAWARQNRPQVTSGLKGRRPTNRLDEDELARVLRENGHKGALIEDNGAFELFIADEGTIQIGDVAIRESIENTADGVVGDRRIGLSFDNVMRGLLRDAGATERELPHLMDVARERYAQRLLDLMDPEAREAMMAGQKAARAETAGLEDLAQAGGLEVKRDKGAVTLVDADSKMEVLKNVEEDEAMEYLVRAGAESRKSVMSAGEPSMVQGATRGGREIPINSRQVPDEGFGVQMIGGGRKARLQEQIGYKSEDLAERGFGTRILEGAQMMGASFTSMENFAKLVEEHGFGPAFSQVFARAQQGLRMVNRRMAAEREALGGRSWVDELRELQPIVRDMPDERAKMITDYLEFATKDEVAAVGGYLQRGMNEEEIRIAERFMELGMEDQIPRMQAMRHLIRQNLDNEQAFRQRIANMERQELSEGRRQAIDRVLGAADQNPDSFQGFLDVMDLTAEERAVINILENRAGADPSDFSIMAVSKYASAPEKPAGFASGREWFASAREMSEQELEVAHRLERMYSTAFEESDLDAAREIGMFWPHMRKYVEQGFAPEAEFIQKELPESVEWVSSLFRTGELDVYARDPIVATDRYLRGMLRKQHLDPHLPEINKALRQIKNSNGSTGDRIHRIMNEFMNEVHGRPHSTFRKAQQAIESGMSAMGVDVSSDFAEKAVNTMAALVYGATIPFRVGLILRNWYQVVQTVGPRVGMRDLVAGLKRAMSDEGFKMARRAGAVPENVAPVHATTEILEDNLLTQVRFGERLDKIVRKGFDYYRYADDFGRSAAYHAQRSRLSRAINRYESGDISWEQMLREGKVKTFRQIDEDRFAEIYQTGDIEGAKDYLGATLARESHFRYGNANHPAGWNSVQGRLFGQFGSWPTQYKDYLIQGMTRGTTKDKAEFLAYSAAANGAVVAGGASIGVNLSNWVTFPSLQYVGGPYADIAMNMAQIVGGGETERALALQSLKYQLPTLENPQSMLIPLSYAAADMGQFIGDPSPGSFVEGLGVDLLRPGDKTHLDYVYGLFD